MNYKVSKEQLINCIEHLKQDNNQVALTSSTIAYNLFFFNIKELLKDLLTNPSPIKNYDYFINNFGISKQSLFKLLIKNKIIEINEKNIKIPAKNIQHKIKRLYQQLTDHKENKELKEETGCGGASGAFETPAFSKIIKKNISENEKIWPDGKEIKFKPECIKYGNNIHCEEGGGSKSPIKNNELKNTNIIEYLNENIDKIKYSNILNNINIIKDDNLTKKLMLLSHKELSGGIKAVWKYANENPSNVVIAFDDNEPIGVITNTNGNQNIYIKPEYRKLGIASKLKDILYNRKNSN